MTETVREFVTRRYRETGKVWIAAETFRETNQFHEVVTGDLTEEMEEWILNNAGADDYYYCVSDLPMFTLNVPGVRSVNTYWFFDSKESASMFKLMFGQN